MSCVGVGSWQGNAKWFDLASANLKRLDFRHRSFGSLACWLVRRRDILQRTRGARPRELLQGRIAASSDQRCMPDFVDGLVSGWFDRDDRGAIFIRSGGSVVGTLDKNSVGSGDTIYDTYNTRFRFLRVDNGQDLHQQMRRDASLFFTRLLTLSEEVKPCLLSAAVLGRRIGDWFPTSPSCRARLAPRPAAPGADDGRGAGSSG